MIFAKDFSKKQTWFYGDEEIAPVIADLAARLKIQYHDFIEMEWRRSPGIKLKIADQDLMQGAGYNINLYLRFYK